MKRLAIWVAAAGIGVVDAALLFAFEFVGVDVTDWLWNDVLRTDKYRWLVVPVTIVLGLALTAAIKLLRDKRVVSPASDLLAEMNEAPASLKAIGVVLLIGAASLLAGGSIGPEAALMAASAAIGATVAGKWRFTSAKQVLVLASVGALLVAFIGSLVLVLVPLLILFQGSKKQGKRVQLQPVAICLLAGLTSFGTIHGIDYLTGKKGGYGTAPALPHLVTHDFVVALVLGFVSAFLALSLNWLIDRFWQTAKRLEKLDLPAAGWIASAVFGLVLGVLYLLGGRTVQFSGSIGSGLLAHNAANYGAAALIGLIVVKVLATAWSKGTGYRGGLVFPSIYSGVALGLLVGQLFSGIGGAGAMVGGISGMLTAIVGTPVMGGIFLFAVLPYRLWSVAVFAILGTMAFNWVAKRFATKPSDA